MKSIKVPQKVIDKSKESLSEYNSGTLLGMAVLAGLSNKIISGEVDEYTVRQVNRYYPRSAELSDSLLPHGLLGSKEGKEWAAKSVKLLDKDADMSVMISTFNINTSGRKVEGDRVIYPNCIIFQAGNFPDKGISISEKDLSDRVKNTSPLYFNLEHFDTDPDDESIGAFDALDGQLGELTKFWIDKEDSSIARAEANIPLWLDENLKNKGISMEIPFSEGSPFNGAAITYSPRIKRAAMFNNLLEFKKKKEYTAAGLSDMKTIHSIADKHTVVKGSKADMATSHEQEVFSAICQLLQAEGIPCNVLSDSDAESMKTGPSYGYYNNEGKKKMPLTIKGAKEFFSAWWNAGQPDNYDLSDEKVDTSKFSVEATKPETKVDPVVIDFKDTKEYKEQADKIKELEDAKNVEFSKANETAVQKLVEEDKITPAEVEEKTKWRAKDPVSFDAHFSTVKPLGNLTSTTVATQDAADRAAADNIDLDAKQFSKEDLIKAVTESLKKSGPLM